MIFILDLRCPIYFLKKFLGLICSGEDYLVDLSNF